MHIANDRLLSSEFKYFDLSDWELNETVRIGQNVLGLNP